MSLKPRHLSIIYVLVPVLAVMTAWYTGFWGYPGHDGPEFGFPLPWRTVEFVPTCYMCPLPTSYNWSFFILDAAFYAAIGYGVVLLYAMRLSGSNRMIYFGSK